MVKTSALAEVSGSIPSTSFQLTKVYNSLAPVLTSWEPVTQVQTHVQAKHPYTRSNWPFICPQRHFILLRQKSSNCVTP